MSFQIISKSMSKKYQQSIPKSFQNYAKMEAKSIKNPVNIRICDFSVFAESITSYCVLGGMGGSKIYEKSIQNQGTEKYSKNIAK